MKLEFAHLADYATIDTQGKLTIAGIFQHVIDWDGKRPILFPSHYLILGFSASVADGTNHQLELRLLSGDGEKTASVSNLQIAFRPNGEGYPMHADIIVHVPAGGLKVPEVGDYEFVFVIDGKPLSERLSVTVRTPPAPET